MIASTAPYSKGRAWLNCMIGLLSAVVLSFIYASVSCSMDLLITNFDIGAGAAGWLITGCYLVSVALALPGGVLVDRFGPWKVGLVGIMFSIVGTLMGVFAEDYTFLMFTRVIQGIGPALLAITVPTVISAWFSSSNRGPAMTLFSLWQSIGIFIVMFTAAFLLVPDDASSWKNMWWFALVCEVLIAILYAAFIRMPDKRQDLDEIEAADEEKGQSKGGTLKGFTSVATWALAVTFACWAIQADTLVNFTPFYCIDVLGLDSAVANSNGGLISIGMIVGGLIMTPILAKVKTMGARLIFLLAGEALLAVFGFFMFMYSAEIAPAFLTAMGVFMMIIPAICFTIAPDTALKPMYLGVTLGIFALAQNLGLGAAIAGSFLEAFGWSNMYMLSMIVSIILIGATAVVMVVMKRRQSKATGQVAQD